LRFSASNTQRIAKNTLMLYFRQILIMLVGLYTVRVVLETLGAEDYGIYNVVAGVVTMFGFLSGSMATASQRFFAFELGRDNYGRLKQVFSLNLMIYTLLIILIILLAETIGLWFIESKLTLPMDRKNTAIWVYHVSLLSFVFTIFASPYMAMIIAHEDMNIYAYISITDIVFKLALAFLLKLIFADKLLLYGILTCTVAFVTTIIYRIVCGLKYKECKFSFLGNKTLFKEIITYTGWSLFGSLTTIIRHQAVTVLLNQFFNPIVIAARSIAMQVNSAVSSFSNNFSTAMNPAIIKSYSAGHRQGMLMLMLRGAKGSYFLMYLFVLPLVLEMPFVLSLWLKNPPEDAALFTQLTLIDALVNSISFPVMTAARATGKIRGYELILGSIQMGCFLLTWIVLLAGTPAYSAMIVNIGISILMFAARLLIVKYLIRIPIQKFVYEAIFPCCIFSIVAIILPLILRLMLRQNLITTMIVILTSILSVCGSMYAIGLSNIERRIVTKIIKQKLNKGL
jgi:O-antigen/teichoic acid export membrane protein